MSEYVRDIIVKRKFQNDNVTVVLKPVKFSDALRFTDLDTSKMSLAQISPLVQDMKAYVTKLDGLKANDASDVSIDELFESAYFAELVTDVLTEWIERGLPSNPSSAGA